MANTELVEGLLFSIPTVLDRNQLPSQLPLQCCYAAKCTKSSLNKVICQLQQNCQILQVHLGVYEIEQQGKYICNHKVCLNVIETRCITFIFSLMTSSTSKWNHKTDT